MIAFRWLPSRGLELGFAVFVAALAVTELARLRARAGGASRSVETPRGRPLDPRGAIHGAFGTGRTPRGLRREAAISAEKAPSARRSRHSGSSSTARSSPDSHGTAPSAEARRPSLPSSSRRSSSGSSSASGSTSACPSACFALRSTRSSSRERDPGRPCGCQPLRRRAPIEALGRYEPSRAPGAAGWRARRSESLRSRRLAASRARR